MSDTDKLDSLRGSLKKAAGVFAIMALVGGYGTVASNMFTSVAHKFNTDPFAYHPPLAEKLFASKPKLKIS